MRKPKVYWTEAEIELLSKEVAYLRVRRPEGSLVKLINLVQSHKLHPSRRRQVQSLQAIPTLHQAIVKKTMALTQPSTIKAPTTPAPLSTTEAGVQFIHEIMEEIKDLRARIARLEDLKQTYPESSGSPESSESPEEQKPDDSPRVAVFGFLPSQQDQIYQRCNQMAQLVFFSKDRETKSSDSLPKADLVLINLKMYHNFSSRLVAHYGRSRIRTVKGITAACSEIKALG